MATNQSQIDAIISAASFEDPAVRLQSLEREVDLLKISIKRILMDIRERMNELENPFTIVSYGSTGPCPGTFHECREIWESGLDAREAALDARESELALKRTSPEPDVYSTVDTVLPDYPALSASIPLSRDTPNPRSAPAPSDLVALASSSPSDALSLQTAYNLFSWTQQGVKRFGNNRFAILVDTYQVMQYIPKKTAGEIRQISNLMPQSMGEMHEIGPDEFVSEIYDLNRILFPHDTSLDRDMIEVFMNQHRQHHTSRAGKPEEAVTNYPGKQRAQEIWAGHGNPDRMNLQA